MAPARRSGLEADSSPEPVSVRPSPWITRVALPAFIIVWTTLAAGSVWSKSPTYDEPLHLTAGYAAIAHGDHRVDPSHPPLARVWAALPAWLTGAPPLELVRIDGQDGAAWLGSNQGKTLAREFLYGSDDPDRFLWRARLMVMLFGLALGVVVFFWTRSLAGLRVALLALGFYAITPTLLAHGALVTTDAAGALFIVATLHALWCVSVRWSPLRVISTSILFAAALLTKFSAVALLPIITILLVIAVRAGRLSARRAVQLAAALSVTAFVAIWFAYGFRYAPSTNQTWRFHFDDDPAFTSVAPIGAWVVGAIDNLHLLPNAFTQGMLYSFVSSHQPAYLLGEQSTEGWWYYFPIAFFVKTPLGLLALFLVGVGVLLQRSQEISRDRLAFVAVPFVTLILLAIASRINIGIRHILPIYPLVLMVAAIGADWLWQSRLVWARPALVTSLVIWIQGFASAYPHTLTFFNRAAGGPAAGLQYLADSNLDWGQHLPALKRWMDERGVRQINLAYFGQADPRHYGIDCVYLPSLGWLEDRVSGPPQLPGFVAISATTLSGVYLPPAWRRFYDGFQWMAPIALVGNSIRVYWVDNWPAPLPLNRLNAEAVKAELDLADGLAGPLKWPALAVRHYETYLQERPADAGATERYGLALLASGQPEPGLEQLQRSLTLDRDRPSAQIALARALIERKDFAAAEAPARLATVLAPANAVAWQLYARVLEHLGQTSEATAQLQRAAAIEPANRSVQEDLTRLKANGRPRR